jgi:hypothetical protein
MTAPFRRVTVCVATPLPAVVVAYRVRPPTPVCEATRVTVPSPLFVVERARTACRPFGPVTVALREMVCVFGSAECVTTFVTCAEAGLVIAAMNRAATVRVLMVNFMIRSFCVLPDPGAAGRQDSA